jgi:hypothetical protein
MATTTTLSKVFHGSDSFGEGTVPGSGGNLNAIYDGWAQNTPTMPEDQGYATGHFPAGGLPSGSERQEFRISDSNAFNNLRGIAKTSFPFDPYPANDHVNKKATSLNDEFQQSDMAGVSSLLPGKYSYNNKQGMLGQQILDEFDAGTSTFNSLPWAEGMWGVENQDMQRRGVKGMGNESAGYEDQIQQGIFPQSIPQQYRESMVSPAQQDVPLTPFHKTYPNFGVGKVDYGFQDPGADQQSADIIRAYHAVLPEGQLAGTKKELMPVFSGVNQEAVEQRPILQSLAKQKNTLYLGGLTELPDDLKIDPREALRSGSNIPADLVQTAGELASALDSLQYHPADGLHTGNPYGARLPNSKVLAPTDNRMPQGFYNYLTSEADEPLIFDQGSNIYDYTSNEADMLHQ